MPTTIPINIFRRLSIDGSLRLPGYYASYASSPCPLKIPDADYFKYEVIEPMRLAITNRGSEQALGHGSSGKRLPQKSCCEAVVDSHTPKRNQ